MNNQSKSRSHWSFWLIAIFTLVWNVLGCINFFVQLDPEMVASYRETEQAIIQGRPIWATVAFAAAVFSGALGCLLLMFRKSMAFYLFIGSLIGVVVTIAHTLETGINFGMGEIIGIIVMPVAVAAFLVWYAKYAEGKGWIGV